MIIITDSMHLKFPITKSFLITAIILATSTGNLFAKADLAPTPPMGWNSWNWHGKKDINEKVVKDTIDAMAENGLLDAGYEYIVIDGGWRDTKLGPNGELLAHPVKFPNGIKPLAKYAHKKGFKFGLHTVPGTHDCGGDPIGGFGNETVHIGQFVDWGLDFVKVDKCRYTPGWEEPVVEETYRLWSDLLEDCGRDIVLSISAYRYRDWYPEVGHMARTTYDIRANLHGTALFDAPDPHGRNYLSVMEIAELNDQVADFAQKGYWNDPDMMVTGPQGLSPAEQRSQFALWCIMSSPLFIGSDPRTMDKDELALLTNKTAIAINQDPREQGRKISDRGLYEVWAKKLTGGNVAVLLLNRNPYSAAKITFDAKVVGLKGKWRARNVFTGKELPAKNDGLTAEVPAGSSIFFITE